MHKESSRPLRASFEGGLSMITSDSSNHYQYPDAIPNEPIILEEVLHVLSAI
jgi:hypothetical protein